MGQSVRHSILFKIILHRISFLWLARTGRIDEAAELFRRIDSIEEMSPEKSDERYYNRFLESTAEGLVSDAELTPEQISEILGFDVSQRKEYKPILERAK